MSYKLSAESITALEKVISGNPISENVELAPYKTGPELVNFFNQFGLNDAYGDEFPSRWKYVENSIIKFNNTDTLKYVIEKALDPRRFLNTKYLLESAINYVNNYFKFDNLRLVKNGEFYVLVKENELVGIDLSFDGSIKLDNEFIREQHRKCLKKILEEDFDGAITNARALIEAVLIEIEKKNEVNINEYDGELIKLYQRVREKLNLSPAQKNIPDSLKQVLTGLMTLVNGISSARNKMSDAHAHQYKPHRHHAVLIVSATFTLVNFLFDTYKHQNDQRITELTKVDPLSQLSPVSIDQEPCSFCMSGDVGFGELCAMCGNICVIQ